MGDCGQDVKQCVRKYGLNCCQDCPIDEIITNEVTKK